jgi:hypothetical protein
MPRAPKSQTDTKKEAATKKPATRKQSSKKQVVVDPNIVFLQSYMNMCKEILLDCSQWNNIDKYQFVDELYVTLFSAALTLDEAIRIANSDETYEDYLKSFVSMYYNLSEIKYMLKKENSQKFGSKLMEKYGHLLTDIYKCIDGFKNDILEKLKTYTKDRSIHVYTLINDEQVVYPFLEVKEPTNFNLLVFVENIRP